MGNKNARASKPLPASASALPPLPLSKPEGDVSASDQSNLSAIPAHLHFRSFQNGNLLDNNNFRHPQLASTTLNMPGTKLSGATPAFVPSVPYAQTSDSTHFQTYTPYIGGRSDGHLPPLPVSLPALPPPAYPSSSTRSSAYPPSSMATTMYNGPSYTAPTYNTTIQPGRSYNSTSYSNATSYTNGSYNSYPYESSSYNSAPYAGTSYNNISYGETSYGNSSYNASYTAAPLTDTSYGALVPYYPPSSTALIPHPIYSLSHSDTLAVSTALNAPLRPSRHFLTRFDKSRKNIVISSKGIFRNIIRVTHRFLPNGDTYEESFDEFDPEIYDLVAELETMSEDERKEFWEANWVEIEVDFRGIDKSEEVKLIMAKSDSNDSEHHGSGEYEKGDSIWVTKMVKNYRIEHTKQIFGNGKGKEIEHPLISNLKVLGSDCFTNIQNLFITLLFPADPVEHLSQNNSNPGTIVPEPSTGDLKLLTDLTQALNTLIYPSLPSSPSSPIPSTSFPPLGTIPLPASPSAHHPVLAPTTQPTTPALTRLEITLKTPTNTLHPLSLSELAYVLPFYDLWYTEWDLKWQSDFMSRPEEVMGWPVTHLDGWREAVVKGMWEVVREEEDRCFTKRAVGGGVVFDLRGGMGERGERGGIGNGGGGASSSGSGGGGEQGGALGGGGGSGGSGHRKRTRGKGKGKGRVVGH